MWTRAAELGSKWAKARLGYLYKSQRPVNNFQLAARWLREAVDDYQDEASDTLVYHWAQCLEFGLGVDPDIERPSAGTARWRTMRAHNRLWPSWSASTAPPAPRATGSRTA